MRQFSKVTINLLCKVSSRKGNKIIFTIRLDPDPILFSDLDPAPPKQITSTGSGSTTLPEQTIATFTVEQNELLKKIFMKKLKG
jgi:hypothetical protein